MRACLRKALFLMCCSYACSVMSSNKEPAEILFCLDGGEIIRYIVREEKTCSHQLKEDYGDAFYVVAYYKNGNKLICETTFRKNPEICKIVIIDLNTGAQTLVDVPSGNLAVPSIVRERPNVLCVPYMSELADKTWRILLYDLEKLKILDRDSKIDFKAKNLRLLSNGVLGSRYLQNKFNESISDTKIQKSGINFPLFQAQKTDKEAKAVAACFIRDKLLNEGEENHVRLIYIGEKFNIAVVTKSTIYGVYILERFSGTMRMKFSMPTEITKKNLSIFMPNAVEIID